MRERAFEPVAGLSRWAEAHPTWLIGCQGVDSAKAVAIIPAMSDGEALALVGFIVFLLIAAGNFVYVQNRMKDHVPLALRDDLSLRFAVSEFVFSRNVPAGVRAAYIRSGFATSAGMLCGSGFGIAKGNALFALLLGAGGIYVFGCAVWSVRQNRRL